MEALEEWLPRHPEFVIDTSREKCGLTFNPKGWLKRVR
jgi:cephalosporin hydroxylase